MNHSGISPSSSPIPPQMSPDTASSPSNRTSPSGRTSPAGFVRSTDLAPILGVSSQSVRLWSLSPRSGFPKPVQVGKILFFKINDLEAYFRSLGLDTEPLKSF